MTAHQEINQLRGTPAPAKRCISEDRRSLSFAAQLTAAPDHTVEPGGRASAMVPTSPHELS